MENLIKFLEINLWLVVFYTCYFLFFRKDTFHTFNRFYLILSSLLAMILPFIKFKVQKIQALSQVHAPEVFVFSQSKSIQSSFDYLNLFWIGYLLVMGILFLMTCLSTLRTFRNLPRTLGSNYAFHFLGRIWVDKKLLNHDIIIEHEKVHVRQLHHLDLIYFQLLKIIFWVNPVVYLFQKSIKQIHEFIADDLASRMMKDKSAYAQLLVFKQFDLSSNQLFIQSFYNQSLIKSRIAMLHKNKSPKFALLKLGFLIPVLLIFMAFKIQNPILEINNIDQNNITKVKSKNQSEELLNSSKNQIVKKILINNDTQPEFPGGIDKMYEFLGNNIKYPEEAVKAGIQGKIYVKFLVEKDGSLSHFTILQGIGYGCDAEAIRILKLMPKWKPATKDGSAIEMEFNMPIKFTLDSVLSKEKSITKEKTNLDKFIINGISPNYDIYINGKLSDKKSLEDLNYDFIKSINVKKHSEGQNDQVFIELKTE